MISYQLMTILESNVMLINLYGWLFGLFDNQLKDVIGSHA